MNTQFEKHAPKLIGAIDQDVPFIIAADIATVVNLASIGEYQSSGEGSYDLFADIVAMSAEITRLRQKLGITDLSQFAEHWFWGEMSCAAECIDGATPDLKLRGVLRFFLDQSQTNDEGLDKDLLSRKMNLSAEETDRYIKELIAVGLLDA